MPSFWLTLSFQNDELANLSATRTIWSPHFKDLLIVSYGTQDLILAPNSKGALVLYTLKQAYHPEKIYKTDSAIVSIDVHPENPNLVCAGFVDGSVALFDLNVSKPTHFMKAGHKDIVWKVKWQETTNDKLQFYSISSDGSICSWAVVKSGLEKSNVVSIYNVDSLQDLKKPNLNTTSARALAFHGIDKNRFIFGTEEGNLIVALKSYQNHYLDVCKAHFATINGIEFSTFHENIFATCSEDQTVKLWDIGNLTGPLFIFNLNSPVQDIAWSQHNSRIFACVTNDRKCHIFDLSVDKFGPIHSQIIAQKKKTKLTSIDFKDKVICVGDSKGMVHVLKLSPNFRKIPKLKRGEVYRLDKVKEKEDLEKIVKLYRN